MLDEIRELNLYTFNPDDEAAFPREGAMIRLPKKDKKRNEFTGISRAFELIARHCLFSQAVPQEKLATQAQKAVMALRDWCGLADQDEQQYKTELAGLECCHNWMPRYISTYCEVMKLPKSATKNALLAQWKMGVKDYDLPAFTKRSIRSSDFNRISIELSVARALRKGPLKRWCMAGKLNPQETCVDSKKDGTPGNHIDVRTIPTILAFTASCLTALGKTGGTPQAGFIPVDLGELGRWLGRKELEKGNLTNRLYEYGEGQYEPLFTQREEISGVKQWRVLQRWLDDGEWQLIDITEDFASLERFKAEHQNEGFHYYIDASYDDPQFERGRLNVFTEI